MPKPTAPQTSTVTLYSSLIGLLLSLSLFVAVPDQTNSNQATAPNQFAQMLQQEIFSITNLAVSPQTTEAANQPPRVGLQIGHLNNHNPPEELESIKSNTGAHFADITEVEVVRPIVMQTKEILEAEGVIVDVLPAVVPPNYKADAFISVHTDGSETNTGVSGFKIAASAADRTGLANELAAAIEQSYQAETKMKEDDNISRNMTRYYAFAWYKYKHAISKETPGVLLETGFLTNSQDRQQLINQPELAARGLAKGILNYLSELPPQTESLTQTP